MRGRAGFYVAASSGLKLEDEKQKVNHHRMPKTKTKDRKPNNLPSITMFSSRRGIQQCENRKKKPRHSTDLKPEAPKPWRRKKEKLAIISAPKTPSKPKTKQPTIDNHVLQSPRDPAARKPEEKTSAFDRSEAVKPLSRGDEKKKLAIISAPKTTSKPKTKQPTIDNHVLQSPRDPAVRKPDRKRSAFHRSEA